MGRKRREQLTADHTCCHTCCYSFVTRSTFSAVRTLLQWPCSFELCIRSSDSLHSTAVTFGLIAQESSITSHKEVTAISAIHNKSSNVCISVDFALAKSTSLFCRELLSQGQQSSAIAFFYIHISSYAATYHVVF